MQIKDVLDFTIPYEFGMDYEDNSSTESIEKVLNQIDNADKNIYTIWGASQFVILSNHWDKVIKIPFNGWFKWDYEANELYFEEFSRCKDYSTLSYEVYEDAVAAGLEKIFAKVEFLGTTKDGTPIYTQEKIDSLEIDGKVYEELNKKSLEVANKIKSKNYCAFSKEWLSKAIDYYGVDLVLNLIDFIRKNSLRDFHSENYGYRGDGSPCIIDFAGFFEG